MPGYIKDAKYDWRIETNCKEGLYAEFNDTAAKAYEVYNGYKQSYPNAQMYCNGKLITK